MPLIDCVYKKALDSIHVNTMVGAFLNGSRVDSIKVVIADTLICPQFRDFCTQIAKRQYPDYPSIRQLRDTLIVEAKMVDSLCTAGSYMSCSLLSDHNAKGLIYFSTVQRNSYFQANIMTATILRDSVMRGDFESQVFKVAYLEFLYIIDSEGYILDTYVVRSEP